MADRELGHDPRDDQPTRCMLYSLEVPGGKIFVGEEAVEAALEDGWHDEPPPPDMLPQAAAAAALVDNELVSELLEQNKALMERLEVLENAPATTPQPAGGKGKKTAADASK